MVKLAKLLPKTKEPNPTSHSFAPRIFALLPILTQFGTWVLDLRVYSSTSITRSYMLDIAPSHGLSTTPMCLYACVRMCGCARAGGRAGGWLFAWLFVCLCLFVVTSACLCVCVSICTDMYVCACMLCVGGGVSPSAKTTYQCMYVYAKREGESR